MLDIIIWDRTTQNIFLHRALRARSKHKMVPSFTFLCPFRSVHRVLPLPTSSLLLLLNFQYPNRLWKTKQRSQTWHRHPHPICSFSNLLKAKMDLAENGNCMHGTGNSSGTLWGRGTTVWGREEISWRGKYNARISYRQVKRLQQGVNCHLLTSWSLRDIVLAL